MPDSRIFTAFEALFYCKVKWVSDWTCSDAAKFYWLAVLNASVPVNRCDHIVSAWSLNTYIPGRIDRKLTCGNLKSPSVNCSACVVGNLEANLVAGSPAVDSTCCLKSCSYNRCRILLYRLLLWRLFLRRLLLWWLFLLSALGRFIVNLFELPLLVRISVVLPLAYVCSISCLVLIKGGQPVLTDCPPL